MFSQEMIYLHYCLNCVELFGLEIEFEGELEDKGILIFSSIILIFNFPLIKTSKTQETSLTFNNLEKKIE